MGRFFHHLREKALKNLLKKVHLDRGIMVHFNTHSGSRELLRSGAENTIWGKVVVSPESGPW